MNKLYINVKILIQSKYLAKLIFDTFFFSKYKY